MTRPQAVTIVTIVALAFAGLASWGVYSYLQTEAQKTKAGQAESIVVAVSEFPIGTKLDQTQVKVSTMPKSSIPAGSFSDPKAVSGRVLVRHVSPGDIITEQKLMPKEGSQMAGVMTYIIPQGHRAVTVGVNEVAGVAGFVAPNNRVDVVLTTPIPRSAGGENISKIILQNVTVLATGQITEQKEGKPVVVPTVTLDLTPEDSERLILAASKGSLQLLLRSIIDTQPVDSKGATITKVLSGSGTTVALPEAPVAAPVAKAKAAPAKSTKPRRAARSKVVIAAPAVQAPASASSPRSSHSVTFIDGGVRTTKEFVLQ